MVVASSYGLNRVGGTQVVHRVAVGCTWPPGCLGWGPAGRPLGLPGLTACPGAHAPLLPHGVLVTSEGCRVQCHWVHFSH